MTIYLLPGLGADERLFSQLDLRDHSVIAIRWPKPSANEPIEHYAAKISSQIDPDAVLIGASFGGMMAIEIGKITTIRKIILVSSVVSFDELPALYRFAGKIYLHKLLTGGFLKRSQRLMNRIMGASDPLRRQLLADMLRDTDEDFLRWAIEKIVTWKNTVVPPNVFRIHGDNDRILPFRRANYRIDAGTHLMIANRADEISVAIKEILVST